MSSSLPSPQPLTLLTFTYTPSAPLGPSSLVKKPTISQNHLITNGYRKPCRSFDRLLFCLLGHISVFGRHLRDFRLEEEGRFMTLLYKNHTPQPLPCGWGALRGGEWRDWFIPFFHLQKQTPDYRNGTTQTRHSHVEKVECRPLWNAEGRTL